MAFYNSGTTLAHVGIGKLSGPLALTRPASESTLVCVPICDAEEWSPEGMSNAGVGCGGVGATDCCGGAGATIEGRDEDVEELSVGPCWFCRRSHAAARRSWSEGEFFVVAGDADAGIAIEG